MIDGFPFFVGATVLLMFFFFFFIITVLLISVETPLSSLTAGEVDSTSSPSAKMSPF